MELLFARWGLVPSWFENPVEDWASSTFNAKSETAADLPSFRNAFQKNWCAIPMSGLYEWKGKQPYAMKLRNRNFFYVLGLWESHQFAGVETLTCTILMTTGNDLGIHARMPVIPDQSQVRAAILNPSGVGKSFFKPYPANDMEAWKVGHAIGSSRAASNPALIEELDENAPGTQMNLF